LKLIDTKIWFKHDDITDEFIRLSGEHVFVGDERIVIRGFLEICGELLDRQISFLKIIS